MYIRLINQDQNRNISPNEIVMRNTLIFLSLVLSLSCTTSENFYEIELKEEWIPMPDGKKLAVDLYMPKVKKGEMKFPVLLEYLPYRKDEHRKRRYSVFSYFVQRGYVVARVDIRGTGRSEGKIVEYEYSDEEQEDGEVIIDWLSRQSFSTGAVGMFGISWGGFNALQMAMRKPPSLKAILAMMATDDIYEDDVHFMDGMMHVDAYEIGRDLDNAIPGSPDYIINEDYFEEKFDSEPWLLKYKQQQKDGPFWDRASLNHDYSALKTPTFLISGWYDGYRDSTPRIMANVDAPVKAIVGPWNHTFPHTASPPPAIEWREEAVRWFDYWLKNEENGIMDEPGMAVFIRDGHGPGVPDSIGGLWRWIDDWPTEDVKDASLFFTKRSLTNKQAVVTNLDTLEYKPSSGIEAGGSVMWWGDWAPDQKKTDAHSLVYDSAPLDSSLVILGFPKVGLHSAITAPQSHFLVRLSDVAPDGSVTLITGAGLNGSHRMSSSVPEKMIPNEFYSLEIEMHFTSWTFKKGHRVRLSVSNAQWPMIWPNPSPLTMYVQNGGAKGSLLRLPVLSKDSHTSIPQFNPPVEDPQLQGYSTSQFGTASGFAEVSNIYYDTLSRTMTLQATNSSEVIYPWAKWLTTENIVHKVKDDDPAHASVESQYSIEIDNKNRKLKWSGLLDLSSDMDSFYYKYTRLLEETDTLIRSKTWMESIPRDFQ